MRDRGEFQLGTAEIAGETRGTTFDDRRTRTRPVHEEEVRSPDAATPARPLGADNRSEPLFAGDEAAGLRLRWEEIQAEFVDEPRRSVERADELVAEAMKRLAREFANERSRLEGQWTSGENASTEDLRLALQRYRSFFHRLLSI